MLKNSVMDEIVDIVCPEDFFLVWHRKLFEIMQDMSKNGEGIDYLTVENKLEQLGETDIGANYLNELTDNTPSLANIETYAKVVAGLARVRRTKAAALEILQANLGEFENDEEFACHAEETLLSALQRKQQNGPIPVGKVVATAFDEIGKRFEDAAKHPEVKTNFDDLDKVLILGLGELIILAGRPSMGKTALALNILDNVCLTENDAALFFSLEMGRKSLGMRLLSGQAQINSHLFRSSELNGGQWDRLAKAASHYHRMELYIDDTPGLRVMEIRARARRLQADLEKKAKNLRIIGVDYLQLCRSSGKAQNREREIASMSQGLKELARELNIPVLVLSQLSRRVEQREDKRPVNSDLRDSGATEQDADAIVFVYRDEYYNPNSPDKGLAEVIVRKQRNGPTGTVKLRFKPEFTRFDDMEARHG